MQKFQVWPLTFSIAVFGETKKKKVNHAFLNHPEILKPMTHPTERKRQPAYINLTLTNKRIGATGKYGCQTFIRFRLWTVIQIQEINSRWFPLTVIFSYNKCQI